MCIFVFSYFYIFFAVHSAACTHINNTSHIVLSLVKYSSIVLISSSNQPVRISDRHSDYVQDYNPIIP